MALATSRIHTASAWKVKTFRKTIVPLQLLCMYSPFTVLVIDISTYGCLKLIASFVGWSACRITLGCTGVSSFKRGVHWLCKPIESRWNQDEIKLKKMFSTTRWTALLVNLASSERSHSSQSCVVCTILYSLLRGSCILTDKAVWGLLQHTLQAAGLAATCISTRETEVGGESWYTWLQLLAIATMGKDATSRNSSSKASLLLKFYQEFSYETWVVLLLLDLVCAFPAGQELLFKLHRLFPSTRSLNIAADNLYTLRGINNPEYSLWNYL